MVVCTIFVFEHRIRDGCVRAPALSNRGEICRLFGFAVVRWALRFFRDHVTGTVHVERYGLRMGDGFECVGGCHGSIVAYGGSCGGGGGVSRERARVCVRLCLLVVQVLLLLLWMERWGLRKQVHL